MRASYNWLRELSGIDAPATEVADRLTGAGLEVEAIEVMGAGLDRVVVGEVRQKARVPDKDKLTLVTVFDGQGEVDVICGAPNVPEPGGRILLAQVGAALPNGMEIGERKIGGVVSRGMICSETELAIGAGEAGIVVLSEDEAPEVGQPAVEALGLRDWAFEIGLTPNRPDCLGHVGLARELAVLYGEPFRMPEVALPPLTDDHPEIAVEIEDPERCPRYAAGLVLGVTIAPSPFWLRYRLHTLGLRAIHNVVDATNLVMLEHGHPTHAFDLADVRKNRIVVRLAKDGERMKTLDGVDRTFTDDDLLICDGEGPVAVAGVMGGEDSEIADTTENVLLECAYFDPRSVRRTSRRLGLHTDASHRFERGVDPNGVERVTQRCTALIAEVAGGAVMRTPVDEYPRPVERRVVGLRRPRAAALLGVDVPRDRSEQILTGLGCELGGDGADAWRVTVPTWRPDIAREADLIEELGRVHGYEHIPTEIPHVRPSAEGSPPEVRFVRQLREHAAAAGLHEAVTYAFVSPRELEAARVSTDAVPMHNPLSEDRSVLRTSLLPGLASAVGRSQRRQVDRVALFELATVFTPSKEVLPGEHRALGVLLSGPRPAWIGDGEPYDLYDAKAALEAILRPVVGAAPELRLDADLDRSAPFLHPARRAAVWIAGVRAGEVGELHPDVADELELEQRGVYAELDVGRLLEAARSVGVPQARALPRFPAVTRDIAMLVAEEHEAGAIAEALAEAAGALAEDVRLFDLYRGKGIPEGHRSLAFRVVYRDPETTLTDKKVEKVHRKVAKAAEERFGATIR